MLLSTYNFVVKQKIVLFFELRSEVYFSNNTFGWIVFKENELPPIVNASQVKPTHIEETWRDKD